MSNVTVSAPVSSKAADRLALLAVVREEKAQAKHAAWETATKARNPQYVVGSLRTDRSITTGKAGHGKVCDIVCACCGETRTINTQDAFQARYCLGCKGDAVKAANRERRAAKSERTPEQITAEIARLTAMLDAKQSVAG